MKVEAYRYAEGAEDEDGTPPPITPELAILSYIDRFGVKAILGRETLSVNEIMSMLMAENVNNAYRSRLASTSWDKWAQENPKLDTLLKEIEVHLLDGND